MKWTKAQKQKAAATRKRNALLKAGGLPAPLPAVMQEVNAQRLAATGDQRIDKLAQLIIAVAKHL